VALAVGGTKCMYLADSCDTCEPGMTLDEFEASLGYPPVDSLAPVVVPEKPRPRPKPLEPEAKQAPSTSPFALPSRSMIDTVTRPDTVRTDSASRNTIRGRLIPIAEYRRDSIRRDSIRPRPDTLRPDATVKRDSIRPPSDTTRPPR